jgi:hypothetical protein
MRGRRSSLIGRRKKKKYSPQRHQGHEGKIFTTEAQRHREALREKMQGRSAKVAEKRGLWFVD